MFLSLLRRCVEGSPARQGRSWVVTGSVILALSIAVISGGCGDSSEAVSSKPADIETGCVVILRIPTQEEPLADIVDSLPAGRLLMTPLGSEYDLVFFNGSSPLIEIDRPALESSVVDREVERLGEWVSSNPQYGASVEQPSEQADCDPRENR